MTDAHPETQAMNQILQALEGLEQEAALRALRWVADVRGLKEELQVPEQAVFARKYQSQSGNDTEKESEDLTTDEDSRQRTFSEFADLYHSAAPKTQADRVLVSGYWLQVIQGQGSFQSSHVNNILRDLGYKVNEIARVISREIDKKPGSIMQVKRNGGTKQGRKIYKLTDAGVRSVKGMIGE
ncbi:hypothetical protein GCM10009853_026740 [Glycomyces scopariae]